MLSFQSQYHAEFFFIQLIGYYDNLMGTIDLEEVSKRVEQQQQIC